ncbi:hypothetical protein C8F01DRAFT_1077792 [Mycena amicta]|nr:hypothetical protein C8F01DRAFT_1077792 [Mycena amicta]
MTLMLRRQIFGIVITSSRSTLSDVVNVGYNPTRQRCNGLPPPCGGCVAAHNHGSTSILEGTGPFLRKCILTSVPVVSDPGPSLLTVSTELQDMKHSQLQAVFYNHPGNCAPVPTPLKAAQRRSATLLGIPLAANFITLRIHQDRANVPSKANLKTARSQLQSNQPGDRCCSNTTGKAAGTDGGFVIMSTLWFPSPLSTEGRAYVLEVSNESITGIHTQSAYVLFRCDKVGQVLKSQSVDLGQDLAIFGHFGPMVENWPPGGVLRRPLMLLSLSDGRFPIADTG